MNKWLTATNLPQICLLHSAACFKHTTQAGYLLTSPDRKQGVANNVGRKRLWRLRGGWGHRWQDINCRISESEGVKRDRQDKVAEGEALVDECVCGIVAGFREIAWWSAGDNYKYKPAANTVGNLQPGWSRFHSSKCRLSNVLAYYDLSFMCSCWGIPCSETAGPPAHNWSGSRSISTSRPSLMFVPLALPLSHPPSIRLSYSPSLAVFLRLFLFYLPPCLSLRLFLLVSLLSKD